MNCSDVSKRLVAYLDRRADSAERHQIESHLGACAGCRLRAEQFRALWGVLDEMPVIEPSFAFDARVRQRVAAEPKRSWLAAWVPQPRLALSAALLASMAVWMVKTPAPARPGNTAVAAQQEDFNAIRNLNVLEDFDVVSKSDVLSELAPAVAGDDSAAKPDAGAAPNKGGA